MNYNKYVNMKTRIIFSTILLFFVLNGSSQNIQQPQSGDFESGVVLFGLSRDYDISHIPITEDKTVDASLLPELSDIFEKYGLIVLLRPYLAFENPVLERIIEMKFSKTEEINNLIKDLENKNFIKYAEKNAIKKTMSIPNDPLYGGVDGKNVKWHLDMIYSEGAWMIQQGDPNIKVAIVDNYVWGSHPDLNISTSNLYNSYNRDPGSASPPSSRGQDNSLQAYEDSHGTHAAGLAGAINNNGIGIASIGGGVTLMGVRAADDNGKLYNTSGGVSWAVSNGANVVNMSYGSSYYSQSESDAFQQYADLGVVLVAAAGNEGDEGNATSYPAGYNSVISVASINGDGKLSYFSQHGSTNADIAAPGGFISSRTSSSMGGYTYYYPNILSTTYCEPYILTSGYPTLQETHYDGMQGTSMASPMVAGLCGLLLSFDATLTPSQIKSILQQTASPLNASSVTNIGDNGYVNAFAALLSLLGNNPIFKISKDVVNTPYLANVDSILIISNHDFSISEAPSWIKATARTYYDKSKRLVLDIEENFSTSPRSGEITIYCADLNSTLTLNIYQEAYPHTLLTDKKIIRISSTQESVSLLNIRSNVHWNLNGTVPDWLDINKLYGDTSMVVAFTATSDNETGVDKTATFTLSGIGVDTIELTVIQSFEELYFQTNKSTVNLGNSIYSIDTIWITSNTDWIILGYDTSLVTVEPTSGYGDGYVIVMTRATNNNYTQNQTSAQFLTNGSSIANISISQKAVNFFLLPDDTEFVLGAEAGSTVTVPINTNMTWYFKSTTVASWAEPNISGSTDSAVVIFTALETNTGTTARKATYEPRTTPSISLRNIYITQESLETSSIKDVEQESKSVSIYPNPTSNSVNVVSSKEIKQLQMISITGKILKNIFPNEKNTKIDLSNLSSGIYFVKIISNDNSVITKKITKQ